MFNFTPYSTQLHHVGTMTRDMTHVEIPYADYQLAHVSAVGSNANDGMFRIGTVDEPDKYMPWTPIGDSNQPVVRSAIMSDPFHDGSNAKWEQFDNPASTTTPREKVTGSVYDSTCLNINRKDTVVSPLQIEVSFNGDSAGAAGAAVEDLTLVVMMKAS